MADQDPRPVPKRLAEFEILRRLGVGGMAEVFLAKKKGAEGTYKLLVVKRVLPAHGSSRRFRAMFAEEAHLATRLNHPNIVQVYEFQDYGEEGQLLSMEYVEGPDLRRLTRAARAQGQRIPPYVACYIIAEVAKGLHYAHERKDERGKPLDIVHRDVSPQNILLSFDGSVKVADFGIASANLFLEEPGVLKGKTAFMSPEQARGEKVDRRADIYSLGVILYELLAGRPVHGDLDGQELLSAVRAGQVEPPSTFSREVPPELEAIVMKALASDRAERFTTARELSATLLRALFDRQQLVDSHVLEAVIQKFVSRERPVIDGEARPETDGSRASAESPLSHGTRGTSSASDEPTGRGPLLRRSRYRSGGEVRHVAVVSLRLDGLGSMVKKLGVAGARRVVTQLRATLDEIAFKRHAKLTWEQSGSGDAEPTANAEAVVGLMANPSRAAADAVWFAVDVHEAIEGASGDLPVELNAKIGIVRGIASGRRDKGGHLIDHELREPARSLAHLLSSRAPAGVSWVAGALYRLVRRDFLWGDAPTIELEGETATELPQSLRVYSLLRPLTSQERLQEMALAPHDLIGRDAELGDLLQAYYSTVGVGPGQGRSEARVVIGELGIGKSALVASFLSELPPDARILRVECSPAKSEVPFATLSEWIRELTGTHIDQAQEQAQRVLAAALGQFAADAEGPEIVARLSELATGRTSEANDEADHADHRRLISLGVRRFFARAAMEAPLVVLVDGLQWCDRPSLELLCELAKESEPLAVLMVLVTRPDERVSHYIDGLVRVELKGLSAENQVRLLQARLGASHGVAEVCADLLPRAAGNPFFLLEMVDALLERGILEIREDSSGEPELVRMESAGEGGDALPSTLEQLIADRLSELPAEEQAIVDWLAVAGGPLTHRDFQQLGAENSDEAIVRLCARGLCDDKGESVDVRHPLTRDVAYLNLDRYAKAMMHRQLGEHLSQSALGKGLAAAVVARHFARGHENSRAADFYLEAAVAARASYQVRLAQRCFRRVVALLPDDDVRRLEAHEALEGICRNRGRARERRQHLTSLRKLAKLSRRPFWVATAVLRTARFDLDSGRLAKGLERARRAEDVGRQAGVPLLVVQAQAQMAEILRDLGDMQGALSAVDRALSTAQASPVPPRLRAEVLLARGTLLRRVGRVSESVADHAEAIAVFRKVGARRMEARAKSSLAFCMYVLGRFEDGVALALDAIRIDLAIGGRFQIAQTLSNIGQCYAAAGDLERGLEYLKRAREAHLRYGDQDLRADTLLATAEVLIEAGELLMAETLVGDARALTAVTESAYDSVHEKILRAVLARAAGDAQAAAMHAFEARQVAEAQAYVAFHFYAMAVEAVSRVEVGEQHTGILLATTAMGAIGTLQGSEYGLQTRALCCEAMLRAGSPQAEDMLATARTYLDRIAGNLRDEELKRLFFKRPTVRSLRKTTGDERTEPPPPTEGGGHRISDAPEDGAVPTR